MCRHSDCRGVRGYPPPENFETIHRRSFIPERFQTILKEWYKYYNCRFCNDTTIPKLKLYTKITKVNIMTYFAYFSCFMSGKFHPDYHHLYVKYLMIIFCIACHIVLIHVLHWTIAHTLTHQCVRTMMPWFRIKLFSEAACSFFKTLPWR